jgi:hypothetical protein
MVRVQVGDEQGIDVRERNAELLNSLSDTTSAVRRFLQRSLESMQPERLREAPSPATNASNAQKSIACDGSHSFQAQRNTN